MLINKFYVNVIVRSLLIGITSILMAFAYFKFLDPLILINLGILFILQIYLLIRKLNLVNNELAGFFNAVQYDDSSLIIKDNQKWKTHRNLFEAIEQLNNKIKQIKMHDAASEAYFKNLVEHIDFGILSLEENGKVNICNTAFKSLLGLDEDLTASAIKSAHPQLFNLFISIKPGEKKLYHLQKNNTTKNLSVHATVFPLLDKKLKLISLQDIKTELDDKEMETWQKMIRVLTHEIMNSISPVSSTIKTIKGFFTKDDLKTALESRQISDDLIKDTVKGLEIIDERSAGLKEFVQKFRSLTLFPKPDIERIIVSELFNDIKVLMKNALDDNGIILVTDIQDKNLFIEADKKLIHQVLINLINNSIDALLKSTDSRITLKASEVEGEVNIEVIDNGEGIQSKDIDNIFTPFYTSRDEGSGIGLSISKQIMRLHGGEICVKSTPSEGTIFRLEFIEGS